MKNTMLIIFLILTTSIYAQQPSRTIMEAFNNDDPKALLSEINMDNLDVCYDIKNSSYGFLAIAIKFNAIECFTALIEKGADIEKICASKTPLLYAVKYGQLKMVKLLIEKGADPSTPGSNGKNAINYAQQYEQKEILDYLRSLN